jgi:hypothetical protein
MKTLLSDNIIFKRSGKIVYSYQKHLKTKGDPRKIVERSFTKPFPQNCIVSPLYLDYGSYLSFPKPATYKTFCVIRDPRDIVVSWYFSVKFTHPLVGRVSEHRGILKDMSLGDGLLYCMEYFKEYGLFRALKSWKIASKKNPTILLIKFEDMVNEKKQIHVISNLLNHCCIYLTTDELNSLLKKYSFNEMQKRRKGKNGSHYRKGVAGDWRQYFNSHLEREFKKRAKNLVHELEYFY